MHKYARAAAIEFSSLFPLSLYTIGHIAKSAIPKIFGHIYFFDVIFLSLSVSPNALSIRDQHYHRQQVYYWILWLSSPNSAERARDRAPCLFALNYWYCVYVLRCQNRIFTYFQISVSVMWCAFALHCIAHSLRCSISLRVIVIFVEYDFICRCHYAVSVAIYVATGAAAAAFLILSLGAYVQNAMLFS